MDRESFKRPFRKNKTPDWICPTCGKGVLRIKSGTFFKEERGPSRDHSHEGWEPEWIENVYSCLLACTNDQCNEIVSHSGTGRIDWEYMQDENGSYIPVYDDIFTPKFFEPHLLLFPIPEECPKSVSEPLHDSFRLFFSVPSAAANNVRIAIEELLTKLKIRRSTISKGRRLRYISLHDRIGLLPNKYSQFKETLLAIKWLGNAGSHANGGGKIKISMDDVWDSYECVEHIVNGIYSPRAKKVLAIARRVNKNKGPTTARVQRNR